MKPYPPCDLKYVVTQKFGEHPEIYTNRRGHPGLDYATPMLSDLYAVGDGIVEKAGYRASGGYGREVFIRIGKYLVIYGHLSEVYVSVGEKVSRGQIIGLSGGDPNDSDPLDGFSTGPHLHFEIRDTTKPQTLPLIGAVDPETWLASDLDQTAEVVPSNEPVIDDGIVTVVSNWVSIRRKPTTVGNEPVGKALYGMDFQKAGDKLPRTGTVKGWQPVIMYIATGQDEDGDYLE